MKMQNDRGRKVALRWIIGSTLAAAAAASPVHAQERVASATATETAEEVVVTGTRRTGVAVVDSAAPIQVLDSSTLQKVGQPDLIQALAQNVPSFTAQAFGGDTANLTLSAKLRGLSPNHALVLVNGKRRHTTANLAVLGGPYQGGASADLNFIPVGAIERVEVLQDGAAAQYGTDAIAGVINIILKKNSDGGSIGANGGGYYDGGGDTKDVTGSIGFHPGGDSYFSIAGETRKHERSDRGDPDPRVVGATNLAKFPGVVNQPGYPNVNLIHGDAEYSLHIASFNGGVSLANGVELYTFGSYGKKHAQAYENYRTPDRLPKIYPTGFSPQEELEEDDFAATAGVKGRFMEEWNWDLSSTYGKDDAQINTIKSGNIALFTDTGSTPTNFHSGGFIASQWTTNFDIGREYDVGMASPLNVAVGIEHRRETYEVEAGDPASRYKEGAQSFPGFALTDAGKHDRDNNAVYVDFALSPIEDLQVDIAGRYEDFSDFGDTAVGKLTTRYDFTSSFALRGTFSTGFRAPTLAEEYYSATNVSPSSAFVQLPPNSPAARLIGVNGLKPEDSTNISLGMVFHPSSRLSATFDIYQIEITDRIVGSGSLFGKGGAGNKNSPAVTAAIAANGNVLDPSVSSIGINVFSNGLDTRTRGAEFVVSYPSDFGSVGRVDWSAAVNYNETEVTKIKAPPVQLLPQTLYDATAISTLEDSSPKYRVVLSGSWALDRFSATLRETVYGESSGLEAIDGGVPFKNEIGVTPITDLEFAYQMTDSVKFTLGANNLLNEYPEKKNSTLLANYRTLNRNSAVSVYPTFSPFGFNGGYYYGKLSFNF